MKIRKLTHLAAFGIAALAAFGGFNAAYAITNGQPDGYAHPCVGVLVVYDDRGNVVWPASGVLLSPTVFLTAAHVTSAIADDLTKVRIFFDEEPALLPEEGNEASAVYTHPGFRFGPHGQPDALDSTDVGVVILKAPVVLDRYGELAPLRMTELLVAKTALDLVGYGAQYQDKGGGVRPGNAWVFPMTRYHARSELITGNFAWSDQFIRVTANPGQGKGGISFGDSGSPALLRNTNTILAICCTVTNYNCAGIASFCRVDTAEVQDWLADLPIWSE